MNSQQKNREISQQPQVTVNIVIYARVATAEKVHPNAKSQTDNLLTLAQQLGFTNEQIIVFDQDRSTAKE